MNAPDPPRVPWQTSPAAKGPSSTLLNIDELERFGDLLVFAQSTVEGSYVGKHKSPYRGSAAEFADYKEYVAGDELGRIDWRVYGRARRLYVRQFEEETDMTVYLLVDQSASMKFAGEKRQSKSLLAAKTAAALAYLMLAQGDKAALALFSDKVTAHVPAGSTRRHLHRILATLEQAQPASTTGLARALNDCVAIFKKRGRLVILSDFMDDHTQLFDALAHFVHRKFEILLLHVVDPDELHLPAFAAARFVDLETGEAVQVDPEEVRAQYRDTMQEFMRKLAADADALQIQHRVVNTDRPYLDAIEAYLGFRGEKFARAMNTAMLQGLAMTFVNGGMLPGLLLLAGLPLLIHLLNLRFPRYFEFSTVKHLKASIAQRSRLFRWRHLILLALRTLLILAVIFVFLRPVLPHLGSDVNGETKRAVLVLIDHSLSMEYASSGVSGRERAQEETRRILSGLGSDAVVNVMTVGAAPRTCFVHFSERAAEARRFVDNLKPGLARADFTQANAAAARLLSAVKQGAEIYYISDFQRKTWSNVDFTPLPATARIFFVDVAGGARKNRGITGVSVNQGPVLAGDTVTLEIEVSNFTEEAIREPVKVLLDARVSFEKEISVGAWSTSRMTFPVPPGAPGLHWCEVSLAPDLLPQDDRFVLTIPVQEKEGILIVSNTPDPGKDALHFLKTALNPYENLGGSLLPQHARVEELDPGRLAAVRKLFVTRSGPLDETRAKLLANFLFQGGGIVWFLDGEAEAANLAMLERAMEAPLPLKPAAKRVVKNVGTAAQQIARGDFKSKFLRLFRGEQRQNLALLEFYDIHEATSTGAGQILLHYADDTPALAQLDHGLGTLLLLNFSASELSSNLARQRIFPAWMQEIVKNLTSEEPQPASSTIGEPVTAEVWRNDLVKHPLMKPSGREQEIHSEPQGERVAITFSPDELGIYTMQPAKPIQAFAVNADPAESDLRPIDRALLPEQLGQKGQQGSFIEQAQDYADLVRGRPIFHWFLFAALAVLLLESLFQLYVRRLAARSP